MYPRLWQRLVSHETVAESIREGLRGNPFVWPESTRRWAARYAANMGCTLLTAHAIERRGHRLKRGARPVGKTYFGAPLSRWVELYILEEQTVSAASR